MILELLPKLKQLRTSWLGINFADLTLDGGEGVRAVEMTVDYLSALNSKGSGLNITQIVDSLVQAETAPQKELLQGKIDTRNTAISALATLSSELGTLKTSISGFAGTSKYTATSTSTVTPSQ